MPLKNDSTAMYEIGIKKNYLEIDNSPVDNYNGNDTFNYYEPILTSSSNYEKMLPTYMAVKVHVTGKYQ